jgi:hypothetical protein
MLAGEIHVLVKVSGTPSRSDDLLVYHPPWTAYGAHWPM